MYIIIIIMIIIIIIIMIMIMIMIMIIIIIIIKGSKRFSLINARLKFARRVILLRGTAFLHINGAFIKLHLIRHN